MDVDAFRALSESSAAAIEDPPSPPEGVARPDYEATLRRVAEVLKTHLDGATSDLRTLAKRIAYAPPARYSRDQQNPGDLTCTVYQTSAATRTTQVNLLGRRIGKGAYKLILPAIDVTYPSLEISEHARVCLRDQGRAVDIYLSNMLHSELYASLHDPAKGIRITPPLEPRRVHPVERSDLLVVEYSQPEFPHDLDRVLRGEELCRRFTFGKALDVCIDLAATLEALHAVGVIHRDVKPSNVLLDRDLNPYLNDFDLSLKSCLSVASSFSYWDYGAQTGLSSPFTDVVGFTVTLVQAIFPYACGNEVEFADDPEHDFFALAPSLTHMFRQLVGPDCDGDNTPWALEILRLARQVIASEPTVLSRIIGSTVRFLATCAPQSISEVDLWNAESDDDGDLAYSLLEDARRGVPYYFLARLESGAIITRDQQTIIEYCESRRVLLNAHNLADFMDAVDAYDGFHSDTDTPLESVVADLMADLSSYASWQLFQLATCDWRSIRELLAQEGLPNWLIGNQESSSLFQLLQSSDAQERVAGQKMLMRGLPSMTTLRERLIEIRDLALTSLVSDDEK